MIVIQGGMLVCPDGVFVGDVALEGSRIVEVASHIDAAGHTTYDARGKWVFPGFIDAHTHLQAWTGMDWTADSFETGTRAAACGGTTTIVDYATADKGVRMEEALDEWHRRADGTCTANYGFHMALAEWGEDGADQMRAVHERGVQSFKTYFAYDHLRLSDAETLAVLMTCKELDAVLCVHCENGDMVNTLQREMLARGITGPEGHPLSRPAEAEAEAIGRLLYLARVADAKVNVVHLSTAAGLAQIELAKAQGQRNIFVETCPQYLLLDESRYLEPDFAGAKYVMSPPLRTPKDCEVLTQALVDGKIDTLATDHCSFNLVGQKDRGRKAFTKIPNGGPGIEHRPALMATLLGPKLGPLGLARLMSENPARVFGMWPRKGCLAVGSDADICVWDPNQRWTISATNQHQALDYTPYEGFEVCGRAALVFVNGRLVVEDGELTGELAGSYVKRR